MYREVGRRGPATGYTEFLMTDSRGGQKRVRKSNPALVQSSNLSNGIVQQR